MTRSTSSVSPVRTASSVMALLAACLFVGFVAGPGCQVNGVGDPCIPDEEYVVNFAGFSEQEVNVESKSFQCRTRLCLANHFRGRASCPYGQGADGTSPAGLPMTDPNAMTCVIPGTNIPVTPELNPNPDGGAGIPIVPTPKAGDTVQAQCVDRTAALTVYCSCRCANVDGQTNDGANYCACPDGYACTQLVTSIGAGDTGLTGAYCIKNNTAYDPNSACAESCDPMTNTCPNAY